MGTLYKEIAFELGDCVDHTHCHATGRAGEVDSAKSEAVNPNPHVVELADGRPNVDRVPSQAVKFGHHQDVAFFQTVQQAGKSLSRESSNAARHGFGNNPMWLYRETSCRDFLDLVLGCLTNSRNPNVCESACQKWFYLSV